MRSFEDESGRIWDVVVGRESWGNLFAIFVPRGSGDARQMMLAESSREAADQLLESLDVAGLRALLARSQPKQID